MKLLYTIIFTLFASTCFANGSWKPCVTQPHLNLPHPYPKVVVPAQPAMTLSTYVEPTIQWVYQPYYSY